jgi:hypothetical protein
MTDPVSPKPATWRITVDTWVSEGADWYGRRVFFVAANNLPAAAQAVAKLPPEVYLDEDGLELCSGTLAGEKKGDDIMRRVRRKRRERNG